MPYCMSLPHAARRFNGLFLTVSHIQASPGMRFFSPDEVLCWRGSSKDNVVARVEYRLRLGHCLRKSISCGCRE